MKKFLAILGNILMTGGAIASIIAVIITSFQNGLLNGIGSLGVLAFLIGVIVKASAEE
ncbi:MAG: hypothetical protein IKB70_03520 [Bacilli bacterium]|nr:hypothetical protein [Bacilli bacterium]